MSRDIKSILFDGRSAEPAPHYIGDLPWIRAMAQMNRAVVGLTPIQRVSQRKGFGRKCKRGGRL